MTARLDGQISTERSGRSHGVDAAQASLVNAPAQIAQYLSEVNDLASAIDDVFARWDFYLKVKHLVSAEPGNGTTIAEGTGQQTWQYGLSVYTKSSAVTIHQTTYNHQEAWHIGNRDYTFQFPANGNYLVCGWQVISNWGDGTNGSWSKAVDQILLTDQAAVHIESQYDRGFDWTLVVYFVDAARYQFADAT